MRRIALALTLTLIAPPLAAAQEGSSAATTVVLLRDLGATREQTTYAGMGLRRGVRQVDGVEFLHPVDELEGGVPDEDLEFALMALDPLADQMQTGDARDAAARIDEVIETLENHLGEVRRSQLVDAYMIAAVARCIIGDQRGCQRRISSIVTFREGLEYDEDRYGAEGRRAFDRARARTLSGPRGGLIIETEPSGVEVFIDGRSYGPSPARAEGLLAGVHYVTVKELGFQRLDGRVDVARGEDTTVTYELAPGERSALLGDRALNRLRDELGAERASPDLVSLFRGTIARATQVIVGVVRPAAGSALHVDLYLYHLGTRNLLARSEVTVSADEAGSLRMEEETLSLYQGVDLSGGLEAPDDETVIAGPQPELYEQWWFWVAVIGGAALVGAGIGIGFAVEGSGRLPNQDFGRFGVAQW